MYDIRKNENQKFIFNDDTYAIKVIKYDIVYFRNIETGNVKSLYADQFNMDVTNNEIILK